MIGIVTSSTSTGLMKASPMEAKQMKLENAAVSITIKSNGFQTSVPVQYNSSSLWYEATYTRPAKYREDELAIVVNSVKLPSSPYTLMAHDYVDLKRTRITIQDEQPTGKTQIAVIKIFDVFGSCWRLSNAAFQGVKLHCSRSGWNPLVYDKLDDNQYETFSSKVRLKRARTYKVRLVLPDGRSIDKVSITHPDQTLAKTLFASGNGLQTGNEGKPGVIDLYTFEIDPKAVVIDESKVKASVAIMSVDGKATPIKFTIVDLKIYYTRPASRNSAEQAKPADAVDAYLRIFWRD